MTFTTYTKSQILSGNYNFTDMNLKMFIYGYYNTYYDQNFLSDLSDPILATSESISSVGMVIDSGAHSSSKSVSLTASSCFFQNITATIPNSYYVILFSDTGTLSTSPILAYQNFYNSPLAGPVYFNFPSSKILYLTDAYYSSSYLYRSARKKMLDGTLGNLQTIGLKMACMSSTYTANIENSKLSSIDPSKIVTTISIPQAYIEAPYYYSDPSLKSLICHGNIITTGTVGSIIIYTYPDEDLVAFYTITPKTLTNALPHFAFYNDIIFTI